MGVTQVPQGLLIGQQGDGVGGNLDDAPSRLSNKPITVALHSLALDGMVAVVVPGWNKQDVDVPTPPLHLWVQEEQESDVECVLAS